MHDNDLVFAYIAKSSPQWVCLTFITTQLEYFLIDENFLRSVLVTFKYTILYY